MLVFYGLKWWKKPGYPEEMTDLGRVSTTLPHADAGNRIQAKVSDVSTGNHRPWTSDYYPATYWRRELTSEGFTPALSMPWQYPWFYIIPCILKSDIDTSNMLLMTELNPSIQHFGDKAKLDSVKKAENFSCVSYFSVLMSI